MSVAYNDIDPAACAWLANLIRDGLLPQGPIWERGVERLEPEDLQGYKQVHLFAGIGGWPLALTWAGWSGPLWTASCPCQPFSHAGRARNKRGADDDPRHLWPALRDLIAKCRPPVIAGEQVASKLGRAWLATVRADMETLGYALGAACLPAAAVGAPHSRARFFWGAADLGLAHRPGFRREMRRSHDVQHPSPEENGVSALEQAAEAGHALTSGPARGGVNGSDARHPRRGHAGGGLDVGAPSGDEQGYPPAEPPWGRVEFVPFADGFCRPIPDGHHQPRILPLADGVPEGMATQRPVRSWIHVKGSIRGYGGAIVPQLGAIFLRSLGEALSGGSSASP